MFLTLKKAWCLITGHKRVFTWRIYTINYKIMQVAFKSYMCSYSFYLDVLIWSRLILNSSDLIIETRYAHHHCLSILLYFNFFDLYIVYVLIHLTLPHLLASFHLLLLINMYVLKSYTLVSWWLSTGIYITYWSDLCYLFWRQWEICPPGW